MSRSVAQSVGLRRSFGKGFREDINGLRAIAVLGVVVYHFKLGPLRGGFAGVDVFFVISGFLMTQIIVGRMEHDAFSLAAFYGARVRRIVPVYVLCILAVMVAGLALLDPWKFEDLARDAMWSLLFASNYLYVTQGGYFAAAPDQNWLIHTWSLAVEWQFYLLFPLLLIVAERVFARRWITVVVVLVVALGSLHLALANSYMGDKSIETSFYMLRTRAWEFLAGTLAAYALPHLRLAAVPRAALHYAGLFLIAFAMTRFDGTQPWPSAATLVPVGGTVLVLLAASTRARWATTSPIHRIGLWSYSIYLWHWPIAAGLASLGYGTLKARSAGALVSIGVGFASYALVERTATTFLWDDRRRVLRLGLSAFAATLGLAMLGVATRGTETIRFALRPDIRQALLNDRAARNDWRFPADCDTDTWQPKIGTLCHVGAPSSNDVLVIGDSYAEEIAPRYEALARSADPKIGITFATRGGCIPIPGINWRPVATKCAEWADAIYTFARQHHFERVVVIGYWSLYDQTNLCLIDQPHCGTGLDPSAFSAALDVHFARAADRWRGLEAQGKRVIVVDVMPDGGGRGDPGALYTKALHGSIDRDVSMSLAAFEHGKGNTDAKLEAAVRSAGATYVDPAIAFCRGGRCPIVENGRTLYKDRSHLRTSVVKTPGFTVLDKYILPNEHVAPAAG